MLGGTFDLSQFVCHLDTDKAAAIASDDRFKCVTKYLICHFYVILYYPDMVLVWIYGCFQLVMKYMQHSWCESTAILFINSFTFQEPDNVAKII